MYKVFAFQNSYPTRPLDIFSLTVESIPEKHRWKSENMICLVSRVPELWTTLPDFIEPVDDSGPNKRQGIII